MRTPYRAILVALLKRREHVERTYSTVGTGPDNRQTSPTTTNPHQIEVDDEIPQNPRQLSWAEVVGRSTGWRPSQWSHSLQ